MRLAARGQRETASGTIEPVEDSWLIRQLKRQAREIHVEALLLALGLAGLALLIPG